MYRYKIYGMMIKSEFKINPLIPTNEPYRSEETITVKESDIENEVKLFLKESNASDKQYEIRLEKSAIENKGGFYLIQNGQISVKLKSGYTYDAVSPWILGYCLSMALLQKGILTIHSSAIATDSGAILIAGTPGAGKSSLAGRLLGHGYKLMADDVAAIRIVDDSCIVYPAFPYQKLCSNEIEKRKLDKNTLIYINEDKDKYLVPVSGIFESTPQKLKAFFYLVKAPVNELVIRKLSGFECFLSIRDNLFLHRFSGKWETAPEIITQCMKSASVCDVYLITRPENLNTLEEISQKIITLIS